MAKKSDNFFLLKNSLLMLQRLSVYYIYKIVYCENLIRFYNGIIYCEYLVLRLLKYFSILSQN